MAERLERAQELARAEKVEWDRLSDSTKQAFLHNADVALACENPPEGTDPKTGEPIYACPKCKDQAYVKGNPCLECNPVGLPTEQVHPIVDEILKSGADDSSETIDSTAVGASGTPATVFPEEKPPKEKPVRKPGKGEYLCSKCNSIHRAESAIGKKHMTSVAQ